MAWEMLWADAHVSKHMLEVCGDANEAVEACRDWEFSISKGAGDMLARLQLNVQAARRQN